MSEYFHYIIYLLRNSMALILLAGALAAAVLGAAFFMYRRKFGKGKHFPWRKIFLWLAFFLYLTIVIYVTMFRNQAGYRQINLHLFRAWREAWNVFSQHRWLNVLLNIALFGPLGFFLPVLKKSFRKWYLTIPAGFCASLSIELLQFAFTRGVCDVDDLFCNTLGTVMGYFLIMAVLSLRGERGKRLKPALGYGALTLASVMAVSSVFFVYQLKEYGNLPEAPAYTIDTSGAKWTLECDLTLSEAEMAVYRTQTRSIEECDAFGEMFRELVGAEYTTISYYQEAAYYMDQSGDENGSHFLFVSYLDQSYEYHCIPDDDPQWSEGTREEIEAALSRFPVLLPEYAEFAPEGEGWHSFTVHQAVEGETMVDGILRCRYAEDGTIRILEDNLLAYTYHDTVEVIDAREAYERLRAGKFHDEGFFENKNPEDVRVLSCEIGYTVDTKGFYQPVYYFEVASGDGSYQDRIMIPAMK